MIDGMRDVRELARELRVAPVDLVRELVSDGVPVVQITTRVFRVDGQRFASWIDERAKRCRERFVQAERRGRYVKEGVAQPKRKAAFRR